MVIRTASGSTTRRMSLMVAMRVDTGAPASGDRLRRCVARVPSVGRVAARGSMRDDHVLQHANFAGVHPRSAAPGTCLANRLVGYMAASLLNSLVAASLSGGWLNRAKASIDSRAALPQRVVGIAAGGIPAHHRLVGGDHRAHLAQ